MRRSGSRIASLGIGVSILPSVAVPRVDAVVGVRGRLGVVAMGMVQAPKLEPRIMHYELSDYERTAIKPMLPNKLRGVPRV